MDHDVAVAAAERTVAETDEAASHYELAGLYYLDDRFDEAVPHLQRAFVLLRDAGDLRRAARVAIDLAQLHGIGNGHDAAARGWVERARMLLERVGPCVEWGYVELAFMACERPDAVELLASTERALTIAIEYGDSDLEATAMADCGLALVTQGRTAEGFRRLDAALAAIAAGEVGAVAAGKCLCAMLTAADRTGDLRRAQEWTAVAGAAIAPNGDRPRALRTHCRVAYGSVLCATGRWAEGEALMIEALGPRDHPTLPHRPLTLAHLANLRIEQGRLDEAAELLAPVEDVVTSCEPLARVHLGRGELDLGAAVARRGITELVGDALRAAPLLAVLVEIELQRGRLDAAGEAAAAMAAFAAAADVAALRADAAVAHGRVLAALGDHPGAIAAFTEAMRHLTDDRPLAAAAVRLELARVLAPTDAPAAIAEGRAALACFDRLGAAPARDRAAALLRAMGDARRPRAVVPSADGLTAREREVLALVRDGLTNAEIGQRLFISAKTAEHHVGRVLAKLGVRSRAEAAALAVRMAANE